MDPIVICDITRIDFFFITKIQSIIAFEKEVKAHPRDLATLRRAKRMGFSDGYIGKWWGMSESEVYALRRANGILPVYKMIDTCASEFDSYIPYFYSTYEEENESVVTDKPSVVVLGAGPIRIGQGVEFDYSTVHAIWAIREAGYEAIIINNNPETVSTDYTVSDKLYFRAAHRGRRDEHHRYWRRPYGRHRVARRADRHQSGRPAYRSWACPSSARTWRPSSARRTATASKRPCAA